jgi:YD repeat-containing protein
VDPLGRITRFRRDPYGLPIEKLSALSREAETLVAQKRLKEAVKKYDRALKLVPEPVERYEATTWLVNPAH